MQVLNYVQATKYAHPTHSSQWKAVHHLSPLAAIFIQCPVRQVQSGNYNHTFSTRALYLTVAAFIYPCLIHCSLNAPIPGTHEPLKGPYWESSNGNTWIMTLSDVKGVIIRVLPSHMTLLTGSMKRSLYCSGKSSHLL